MANRLPPEFAPLSGADRAAKHRAKRRSQNRSVPRGKHRGKRTKPTLFDRGQFVAVDGEGFSEGPELQFTSQNGKGTYTGKAHYYALLKASDGAEIYSDTRLTTEQCLNFLIGIKLRNPRAIVVCFGGSYDTTQMLCHGLTREQLAVLTHGDGLRTDTRKVLDVSLGNYDYRLEYRPRKSLTIWRWNRGESKYTRKYHKDGSSSRVLSPCASVTMWDVWGFFQGSFVEVIGKWMPDDPDFAFVQKMKAGRKHFQRGELTEIKRYTDVELRCLVQLMNMVRDAVRNLGLKLTRWDGAGAIAAAMMKLHNVKEHKAATPVPVFEAAQYAYSGGHIEVCKIGYHNGPVYHYDVSSAYPDQFRNLPSLAAGRWVHGTGRPPDGFTVVRVAYRFMDGMPFYPLFFRQQDGTIIYPSRGTGWHWYPEFEAAREYAARMGAAQFEVLEWWHFDTARPVYPFKWIDPYYERRQELVDESKRTKIPNGEEKIIKLGLNSLYGKTCQQVGARIKDGAMQPPPFFQLEWGGYVTAGCRAKLMQAALQNPWAIIGFATDGLFSTAPLDLYCPPVKELGSWEFEKHDGITMVMPGVYWLHEDGKKPKHYSRGFDKDQMSDAEFVHDCWRRNQEFTPLRLQRLIGIGSAVASDTFYEMRGMFVSGKRELRLDGLNSKRYSIMLYRERPHLGLIDTVPVDHYEDMLTPLSELHSHAYEISWIPKPIARDAESDVADQTEAEDAALV